MSRSITRQWLVKTQHTQKTVSAVVNCKVCELVMLIWLPVLTVWKCSINPITNPNLSIVTHTCDNITFSPFSQDISKHLLTAVFIHWYTQSWPPLWSSSQSSWLQIQRSGFDSRHYQIFWVVVGLERGPLSLVSTTEELLERRSSGSRLENQDCGHSDLLHWLRNAPLSAKIGINFTDKQRLLGWYSLLVDYSHRVVVITSSLWITWILPMRIQFKRVFKVEKEQKERSAWLPNSAAWINERMHKG
jgi:hypothetical protein